MSHGYGTNQEGFGPGEYLALDREAVVATQRRFAAAVTTSVVVRGDPPRGGEGEGGRQAHRHRDRDRSRKEGYDVAKSHWSLSLDPLPADEPPGSGSPTQSDDGRSA